LTSLDLLKKFEDYYGKDYTDAQRAVFLAKVGSLDEQDLPRVYSEILESCKRLPLIAEIYSVARAWGMLPTPDAIIHHWQSTLCKLCAGEGRIMTVWLRYFDDDRKQSMLRLEQVMPYSSREATNYHFKDGEYSALARCKCEAGDASTLPPKWPRWSSDVRPVRLL